MDTFTLIYPIEIKTLASRLLVNATDTWAPAFSFVAPN